MGEAVRDAAVPLTDRRGFTLLEVLIGALLAGIFLLGLSSLYLAATRSLSHAGSTIALQRQGALALEEIARRVRGASTLVANCAEHDDGASPSPDEAYCYAEGTDAQAGALCEIVNGGGCRNLLAGAPQVRPTITLLPRTDPRCPSGVTAGSYCLAVTATGPNRADVAFAITDGLNAIAFTAGVMRRN